MTDPKSQKLEDVGSNNPKITYLYIYVLCRPFVIILRLDSVFLFMSI